MNNLRFLLSGLGNLSYLDILRSQLNNPSSANAPSSGGGQSAQQGGSYYVTGGGVGVNNVNDGSTKALASTSTYSALSLLRGV